jgi:hypothetical protein
MIGLLAEIVLALALGFAFGAVVGLAVLAVFAALHVIELK